MSDDEYEFQYSDDEGMNMEQTEDDVGVQIQNAYYTAKGMMESDVSEALSGFARVVALCEGDGHAADAAAAADASEWAFKAVKRMVKLHCTTGNTGAMMEAYRDMLRRITSNQVTRNRADKAMNSVLELVASRSQDSAALRDLYRATLSALAAVPGTERLVFKTNLKLARLLLSAGNWVDLEPLLNQLLDSVSSAVGDGDDRSRGTQQMEVYALQIQMYTALQDTKRAGEVYKRAMSIKAAVPHPSITAVIREAGGKLHMAEREWEQARVEFLEAFKAHGEAGAGEKTIACLQYMLLANMLAASRINPFDSQETKAFERDPRIATMTQLTDSYLSNDISRFQSIIDSREGASLRKDDFMGAYIGELETAMRLQVLVEIVRPYTRMRIDGLAKQLGVAPASAEALLTSLILDGKLEATIDQVVGTVTLKTHGAKGQAGGPGAKPASTGSAPAAATSSKYQEITAVADKLSRLTNVISSAAARTAQQFGGGASAGIMGAM